MLKLRLAYCRKLRLLKLQLQHHLDRFYSRHDNTQDRALLFFQEYDVDSSGAIDVSELSIMAAYLGCALNYREQQLFAADILHIPGDMYEVSDREYLDWYSLECGARVDETFRAMVRQYVRRCWRAVPLAEKLELAFQELDVALTGKLPVAGVQHVLNELGVSSNIRRELLTQHFTWSLDQFVSALPWGRLAIASGGGGGGGDTADEEQAELDERLVRFLARVRGAGTPLELKQIYSSLDADDPAKLTVPNLLRLAQVERL
jgi:Ca2+-binding EF-hand superfamily protein